MISKSKFMTKVNPNCENETKSYIFDGSYSNLTSFFISKMMEKSSKGKAFFIYFRYVNVIGNWAHLPRKNSKPGAKITRIFRLS